MVCRINHTTENSSDKGCLYFSQGLSTSDKDCPYFRQEFARADKARLTSEKSVSGNVLKTDLYRYINLYWTLVLSYAKSTLCE